MQESKVARVQGYKVPRAQGCLALVPTTRSFQGCKGSKVQESTLTRIQGCHGQGYKGPRIQGCLGLVPTSRHCRQPDPETRSFQGSKGSKVQESTHTRIQGCKVPRIQGSKDTRLFGPDIPTLPTARPGNPELSRVQMVKGTRVHTYKNPRLPGSKDTRF